jgi:hypothetical protein
MFERNQQANEENSTVVRQYKFNLNVKFAIAPCFLPAELRFS